jgi:hypothetical protein
MCGIALPSLWERWLSDKNGRDIFLIVLGVFQVGSAGFVFVYRGIALALPVLLYDLWGVVSGLRLIFRRTIGSCRVAAIWYLPTGLFFLAYGMHTSEHYPTGHSEYVFLGVALLSIFGVLAVPLLPGYYPGSRRADGMIN